MNGFPFCCGRRGSALGVMTSARLCTGTTFVLSVLIRSVCCRRWKAKDVFLAGSFWLAVLRLTNQSQKILLGHSAFCYYRIQHDPVTVVLHDRLAINCCSNPQRNAIFPETRVLRHYSSKSVQRFDPQLRWRTNKQKSTDHKHAPELIDMPFGVQSGVHDVITHANFCVNRLRGFSAAARRKLPFPILFRTTLTTVLHYRADCDRPKNLSNTVEKRKKGYYGVQGHSRSSRSVPIKSLYAISY